MTTPTTAEDWHQALELALTVFADPFARRERLHDLLDEAMQAARATAEAEIAALLEALEFAIAHIENDRRRLGVARMSKPQTEAEYWEKSAHYWQQRATDAIEARAGSPFCGPCAALAATEAEPIDG